MESAAGQLAASANVTALLLKYFPHTPVVPVYGNHEGFPANLYLMPQTAWLTEGLADMWQQWLPGDAKQTVLRVVLESALPHHSLLYFDWFGFFCFVFLCIDACLCVFVFFSFHLC